MRFAPESSPAPIAQQPDLPDGAQPPLDSPPRRASIRPLFDVDPGWLFILAGLALFVAGVLIPAKRDLFQLHSQLDALRERERLGNERLRLHARFLADLDETDPALTRRLAASQLNVVPKGDVPVVLASSGTASLTDWIDARAAGSITDREARLSQTQWPDTTLTRLATGPQRLWLLGGGVLAVFVGLMLGPAARAHRRPSADEAAVVSATVDGDDALVQRGASLALEEVAEDDDLVLDESLAFACEELSEDDESLAAIDDAEDIAAADAEDDAEDDCEDCADDAQPLEPLTIFESPHVDDAGDEGSSETGDSLEYETNREHAASNEIVCEIITASEFAASAGESDLDEAGAIDARDLLDRRSAAD